MYRRCCALSVTSYKSKIRNELIIDYTTKSTIFELFKVINSREVQKILKKHGCDRYAKKLEAHQLIVMLILAQQNQCTGTRTIQTSFEFNRKLRRYLKLDSISHTQVFRRLKSFPIAAIEEIFNLVVKRLGSKYRQKISKPLHGLNLIDASTITKSLKGMEWARFRNSKAGIKLHLSLMYHDEITYPNNVYVSRAKEHDVAYLKDLVVISKNTINVFDRGYVDYQAFDQFSDAGVSFVTRLKENAATWVIKRYETDDESKVVYHDLVTVGCGKKKTRNAFRYIQLCDDDGKHVQFLTNVMDKTPEEIGDIYKLRWQIELFFKWIKQNLKIKHFYATSEQAITVQVYIALIAYCLFRLISVRVDPRVSLRKIKSAVLSALFDPFRDIVEQLIRISPH